MSEITLKLRAHLVLGLLLVFAHPAAAQINDMEDLLVSANRVPDFVLPELPNTTGWKVLNVTKSSDCPGCNADPADNSHDDGPSIQACVDAAAAGGYVCFMPPGTYNLENDAVRISDDNIVLRGAGSDRTFLVAADGAGGGGGCGVNQCWIDVRGGSVGSATAWTGGYGVGETVFSVASTAGIAVGDWIRVSQDDSTSTCNMIDFDSGAPGFFWQFGQVVGVGSSGTAPGAGKIEIDRGLVYDYASDNCRNEEIRKVDMVSGVGLENFAIRYENPTAGCTSLPSSTSNCDANGYPLILFFRAVNSWLEGSLVEDAVDEIVRIQEAGRIVVQGNEFRNLNFVNFNTEAVHPSLGAGANLFENNICRNVRVCTKFEKGTWGNVWAYNWHEKSPNCERDHMMHGKFSRANIIEGNDGSCGLHFDSTWGRNGPYNTWYRNRMRGGARLRAYNSDKSSSSPTQLDGNWIGNTVDVMDGALGSSRFDARTANEHIGRGVARSSVRFDDSSAAVNLRVGFDGPDPSWAGLAIPDSLYRSSPPEWWCQEACDWAGETGIGAFGDDFGSGSLCKLPAQIRAEGGICTPLDSAAPPAAPARPVSPFVLE